MTTEISVKIIAGARYLWHFSLFRFLVIVDMTSSSPEVSTVYEPPHFKQ